MKILFKIFIFIFLLEGIFISIGNNTRLHLYQIITPIIFIYLVLNLNTIKKFKIYEKVFFIFYFYLAISFFWAEDKNLALNLILLELMLIFTYLYMRIWFYKFKLKELELFLYKLGKYYIIGSFIMYLIGLYIYNTTEHTIMGGFTSFGLLQENIMPRLRGFTSSPNNYIYFSLFFFIYFLYFKDTKFILFTFLTIILSFSTTGIGITIIILLLFYYNKITFKGFLILSLIVLLMILLFYLYIFSNQEIMDILKWRLERNRSGTGRFELWIYALDLINQNIFGYGINQTRILIHNFHALNSTHNSIIEVFLTGGIIGLFLYLAFYLSIFFQSLIIWKKRKDIKMFLLFISFIMMGLSNNTIHIGYGIFYLAILHRYSILNKEK